MYRKILSYRLSYKPSLVFLVVPILLIFIFIAKSFDQKSSEGFNKNQELEDNLSTAKIFYLINLILVPLKLNIRQETETLFKEFSMNKKFHLMK